jgi:hypothetical protein
MNGWLNTKAQQEQSNSAWAHMVLPGTAVGSANRDEGDNSDNPAYDGLLAIWDAYNGTAVTELAPMDWNTAPNGRPSGWGSPWAEYASATPDPNPDYTDKHLTLPLAGGWYSSQYDGMDQEGYRSAFYVALEAFEPGIIIDTRGAPVMTGDATADVQESSTGTFYTATATQAGNTLTYALDGTDAALFSINASTGAVGFLNAPDFEAPGDEGADNVYNIDVTASNGVYTSLPKAVAITVGNVYEAPVMLTGASWATSFNEGALSSKLNMDVPDTIRNAVSGYASSTAFATVDATNGFAITVAGTTYNTNGNKTVNGVVTANEVTVLGASPTVTDLKNWINGLGDYVSASVVETTNSSNWALMIQGTQTGTTNAVSFTGLTGLTGATPTLTNTSVTAASVVLDTANQQLDFSAQGIHFLYEYYYRDDAPIVWADLPEVELGQSWSVQTRVSINDGLAKPEQSAGIVFYDADGGVPNFYFSLTKWIQPTYTLSNVAGVATQSGGGNGISGEAYTLLSPETSDVYLKVQVTELGLTDHYQFFYKGLLPQDPWIAVGDARTYTAKGNDSRVGLFYKTNKVTTGVAFDDFAITVPVSVAENSTGKVYTANAIAEGEKTLTYALSGTDSALFNIHANTGELAFKSAPNFEEPLDVDGDNLYDLTVTASDGVKTSVPQPVVIAVTNVVERSAVNVTVAPAQVSEGDADKLVYTFTRSQDFDGELTVDIGVTGTAGHEDYSRPVQSQWTRLMGANRYQQVPTSASVGADGVYVSGRAESSLLDGTNELSASGGGYVRKFDADGSLVWTRLTDAVNDNYPYSVTTGVDGGVYVAGMAYNPAQSNYDGFVNKFDTDGALAWTSFVGFPHYDYVKSVSADAKGAVYVAGFSANENWSQRSSFLSQLTTKGDLAWTRPVDGSDHFKSVSATADGGVFVTGYANSAILDGANKIGELGSYVSKFDASGTSVWTRLPEASGSSQTNTVSAGADGAVYVAGYAYNYSSQNTDGFVTKFDADGSLVWTSYVGGSGHDDIKSVFTGQDGAVYLAGETYSSSLNGQVIEGTADTTNGFVGKFDAKGTLVWTHLIGGSSNDLIKSISVDADGVVYVAGETYSSSLNGQNNQGNVAGFVSKILPTSLTQVTFAPGSATATLTLPASADAATEGNETVTVTVMAGQAYTVGTASSATGSIEDNLPPVITSDPTATAAENSTGSVYTAIATDANAGSALTYSLSGTGTDDALFEIDDDTGEVSFKAPPNYEAPADAGSDNIYNITVTASDGVNTTEKAVAITVTYVDTEAPVAVFSAIKGSNGDVLTAGPTKIDTLILSGSNEEGSTVNVYNGSVLLGQATVTGTAWSYIVTASNGESYNLKITETDLTGNVSAPKAYLPGAGDAVIDLGVDKNGADYGQLIAPVQVDGGKWFYHWDLSRDGTGSDIDSNGNAADHFLGWALNDIFNKDVNGVQGPGTSETYRYATLNDVHLALPTMGLKDDVVATFTNYGNANGPMSVATLSGVSYESSLQAGTVIGSLNPSEGDNTINPLYNDLLAIWDAHNGNASTDIWRYIDSWNGAPFTSGVPVGWSNQPYTSASNSYVVGWGVYDRYQDINLSQGWIAGNSKGERDSEYNKFMVALEVFEPSIVIDTTAPIAPTLTLGTGVDNGATLDEATDGGGVVAVTAESGVSTVVTFSRNSATVSKSVIGNGDTPVPVTLSSADLSTLGDGTISVSSVSTDAAGNATASTGSTSFELNTLSTVQVSTSPASANEAPANILPFVSNLGGLNWTTVGAYSVYSFTEVGTSTFTVNSAAPVTMEALLVAGGAAGAWSGNMVGGGGGGGGVAYIPNFYLSNATYTITVGAGGVPDSGNVYSDQNQIYNGGNTSVTSTSGQSVTVYGGGVGGGNSGDKGSAGGSGGGGHWSSGQGGAALSGTATGIDGVVFYGSAGGQSDRNTTAGGGGGGATTAGADATLGGGGNGGEGFESAITGTAVVYGSGGGGGGNNSSGLGGTNGGDATSSTALATSGVTNTGSGGGGSGISLNGSGGSGIVVLRYIAGIQAEAGTPYKIEGIQIGDPDAAGSYTVTFTQTNGVLAVTENVVGGLVTSAIEGNNSDKVALTGTMAQINATLAADNGFVLTMNSDFTGAASLTMATNDGQGGSDTDVIAVTVPEPSSPAGQSVIDLGSYGQLIAPIQVEGKWYYHLDRNGDGTIAGDAYTMSDANTYPLSEIYELFKQDVNGVAGSSTNDTHRYGTVNGVKLAMPTLGTSANPGLINGTDLNSPSQTNPSYDDLSAIWDAYNGTRVGSYSGQNLDSSNRGSGDITSGAPGAWVNDSYVSATPWPSSTDYAALRVYDGLVFNHANWGMNVALQVL